MSESANRRKPRRWPIVLGLGLVLVIGTAFAVLRIVFDGPALGAKLASFLNKKQRGRIEIGSIEWPSAGLQKALTGGWVPIEIRDVRVWDDCALADSNVDPEKVRVDDPNEDCTPDDKPDPDPKSKRKPRKLLLATPRLTAEIDIHAVMFGNHDIVLRHVVLHGGDVLIEQTREPQPMHAYNRTIVSLISAFYPRLKAGFRAGIYATKPPPIFDVRDVHLQGVNVTVHVGPSSNSDGSVEYSLAARIEGVDADADSSKNDAYLYMDARDPLVQKFYVRVGLRGQRGHLRIRDKGPREAFRIAEQGGPLANAWAAGRKADYEIDVSTIEIRRLAQMPTEWPRKDFVANSLELDATLHTLPCKTDTGGEPDPKDGADVHVTGGLVNYWDRPFDGQWDFHVDAENLGPTVRTCIKSTVGGDHLGGKIAITGPFVAMPKIDLDLHDLDVDIPLSKKEEPIRLTLSEVHGGIDLVNEEGYIDQSKALVQGGKEPGEALLSAKFGLKPLNAKATLDILKPLDVGRFLPPKIAASVGRYLAGKLTVGGDIEQGFEISNFSLDLGPLPGRRPEDFLVHLSGGRMFAKNDFEDIDLQRITFRGGKTNATINGKVRYVDNDWDYRVAIDGKSDDLNDWLKRFGLPAIIQRAGGAEVIITGRGNKPTITVSALLSGIPCIGSVQANTTTTGSTTTLRVASGGFGGELRGDGVIVTGGAVPVIERLHLSGTQLSAAKICGLQKTIDGTIDTAELDLKGSIDPNRATIDWAPLAKLYATAQHLVFKSGAYTDRYSDIAVCLNRSDADDAKLCRRATTRGQITQPAIDACADAKAHSGACLVTKAVRDRGGTLDATVANLAASKAGRVNVPAHLAGDLALDSVPMAILEPLVGPGTVGGLFSTVLHLSGQLTAQRVAPQATGVINLLRGWLGGAFLADLQLSISPTDIGKTKGITIEGNALAGALSIVASVGTEAPFPVDVAISGRRVEVDQFVDLQKKLGLPEPVQIWASGTVSIHTELAPAGGKPAQPEAWVEVTELEAIVDHRSRDGRQVPLRFTLAPRASGELAMSLRATLTPDMKPATLELACRTPNVVGGRTACPARLETPAGVVSIEGSATAQQMHLAATGQLDLKKLLPLLETQLDDIAGQVVLDATVSGTVAQPSYSVIASVQKPIMVRPVDSETQLQVLENSQVVIANGRLSLEQFKLSARGERGGEEGVLSVKGGLGFDTFGQLVSFKPSAWDVHVTGKLAGQILQLITPKIAQASGLARIDGELSLTGKGALPLLAGALSFDPAPGETSKAQLAFVLRGLRREIAMIGGRLSITTDDSGGGGRSYTVSIAERDALRASVDGEGKLDHVHGEIVFRDGAADHATIDLDADNVPFRIPGTLDLTFAAKDVELRYANDTWGATGEIAIVSGAYKRNFDLGEAIKPTPTTVAPAKSVWDEYPSIGNAQLDLVLDVRRFQVAINIAHIDFSGSGIQITGSPKDPRLQGSIVVTRGDFKIPLTRAKFEQTSGSIDFAPNERATNPKLDIASTAPNYQDLSGQQHSITLAITGTLEQPLWDLHTSTGLDKSQTLALLLLGRSPEQLRRSLGDQALGQNPVGSDPTTNPSTGFGDQLVKDLAGDWVSDLIGGTLTKKIGLDVLRFELGFGTVGVHAEKKIFENIRLFGDAEQTVRGQTESLSGEVRTPYRIFGRIGNFADRLSAQGTLLHKQFNDPADQGLNVDDQQLKVVYHLFIP